MKLRTLIGVLVWLHLGYALFWTAIDLLVRLRIGTEGGFMSEMLAMTLQIPWYMVLNFYALVLACIASAWALHKRPNLLLPIWVVVTALSTIDWIMHPWNTVLASMTTGHLVFTYEASVLVMLILQSKVFEEAMDTEPANVEITRPKIGD